jgi:hypothetical protein
MLANARVRVFIAAQYYPTQSVAGPWIVLSIKDGILAQ